MNLGEGYYSFFFFSIFFKKTNEEHTNNWSKKLGVDTHKKRRIFGRRLLFFLDLDFFVGRWSVVKMVKMVLKNK